MKADIYVKVRFRTSSEGGRKTPLKSRTPLAGDFYACPLLVDGEAYDYRLLIGDQELELGEYYELPTVFLNKTVALHNLSIGKNIILWEGKDVADGEVTRICN